MAATLLMLVNEWQADRSLIHSAAVAAGVVTLMAQLAFMDMAAAAVAAGMPGPVGQESLEVTVARAAVAAQQN